MLIALLAVLGVDLIVIVAVLGVVLSRKRWVSHQPSAFRGAIRVTAGDVQGLGSRWKRGYGRWVGEVLVWTKAPFLFRNELVEVAAPDREARPATHGEVRRIGKDPTVVSLRAREGGRIEIAAAAEKREQAAGPFATTDAGRDIGRSSSAASVSTRLP